MGRMAGLIAVLLLTGCTSDPEDGDPTPEQGDPIVGAPCNPDPTYTEDVSACKPAADDYQPRDNGSADDLWPTCISDDNIFHPIGDSTSSISRTKAYQDIIEALWIGAPEPIKQDFIDARVRLEEEQGLGSRLARRYDPHYPAPATGKCEDTGVPAANPDYCVGPAKLQPIVTAAFAAGALGKERVKNAARIHAALQWFFYVSAIKESTSCANTPADCDSAWAYYSGGTARSNPIGLGAEIRALAPETHERVYDGLLAVRCWRNLDNETGTAKDLTTRDRAIAQLDWALLRGMAVIVRQRFAQLRCAKGDYQAGVLEELRILIPLLDRATREREAAAADLLLAEVQKEAVAVDVDLAFAALDRIYACP